MRRAALLFVLATACASRTAIVGVNVIPMDREGVLADQTVIVRGERIERVGDTGLTRVPLGAKRIDGRGKYLIPGLADLHVHVRALEELDAYLRHGVTTIAHLSGAEPGAPDLMRYRDDIAAGRMRGPALYLAGPLLDGPRPIFPKLAVAVPDAAAANRIVREQKSAGYDFIKTYYFLPLPAYLEAVKTAHEVGMPAIGHLPGAVDLYTALDAGHDLFAHVSDFVWGTPLYDPKQQTVRDDDAEIARAVAATVASKTVMMPALIAEHAGIRKIDEREAVLADPRVAELAPVVAKMWRGDKYTQPLAKPAYPVCQKITKALHDAGVTILTGTDAALFGVFPGSGLHEELQELVAAGLRPWDALAASTVNAGTFVNAHVPRAQPFGVIQPGYRADLVLLRADPLADIRNVSQIDAVMAAGRWVLPATRH